MSTQQNVPQVRYASTSQVRCPDCDEIVQAQSMNIAQGVALCASCGKVTRLSELNRGERTSRKLLERPPDHYSLSQIGDSVKLSVSLRSIPAAIVFGIFALIMTGSGWLMGFSSFFPDNAPWFFLLANLLVSIPFYAAHIALVLVVLMLLFGKVSVVIDESGCYTATGFDIVSWKKRFDMHSVRKIEIADTLWRWEGGANKLIKIEADQTIKFASTIGDDARSWMVAVLRHLLVPGSQRAASTLSERFAQINKSANA